MSHVFIASCCLAALTPVVALCPPHTNLRKRDMALQNGSDTDDLLRTVDSRALLRELARRGIEVDTEATSHPTGDVDDHKPRQSHVVGDLRPKDSSSDQRSAALDLALQAIGIAHGGASLLAGPPLKAYNAFVRPRDPSAAATQSVEVCHSLECGLHHGFSPPERCAPNRLFAAPRADPARDVFSQHRRGRESKAGGGPSTT